MTLRTLLSSSAALSALSLPASALITDGVWQSHTGFLAHLGVVADPSPWCDGSRVVMQNLRYIASLPLDAGTITLSMPDVTFSENADSTVTITYPESFRAMLNAAFAAEGPAIGLEMVFALRLEDSSRTSSGTPGAFTFDNADRTTFPGFPRPEGRALAHMAGPYGALDRLAQTALLPTDVGIGLRGAIGMIAKARGEDELESLFVIAPDGTMNVNGLPLLRP